MATNNTRDNTNKSLFVYVTDNNTGKIKRVAVPADVQVGLRDNPAGLQLTGKLSLSTSEVQATKAVYVGSNNTITSIRINDANLSSVTAYLPTNARTGQVHIIKDASGVSETVPINVSTLDNSLIDGSTSLIISTSYGSTNVFWNSNEWLTFSSSTTSTQTVIGVTGSSSDWVDTGNKLSTTSSIAISNGTENTTNPAGKGQDVYFYVSGTIGVSTASSPSNARVSLFGGDVRISGSLTLGSGSIKISSNDIQFTDSNTRIERSTNDLKFYDVNNPSGKTLSSFTTCETIADFVTAQSSHTMLRWTFNSASIVNTTSYTNSGVSSSIVGLTLTASRPNNIRTNQSGVFAESVGFTQAYYTAPDTQAKIAGSNITISAWIRPVVTGSGFKQIITKEYASGTWVSPFTPVSIYQLFSDNALIEFGITTAGSRTVVNSDSNTALKLRGEQWNHVALVYNGTFILGYINGVETARVSKTGDIDYGTTPGGWVVAGNSVNNNEYFSGSIDDLRVEDVCWTPQQIREQYETGVFKAYVCRS